MPARTSKRTKAKQSPYVKDENPELRKVARALRSFVKKLVPDTKETVNAWGVPTFEAPDPFCFYMAGKNHVTFGFHLHVKLREVKDLEQKGLRGLVQAAVRLKGKAPMKGMSGKRKSG